MQQQVPFRNFISDKDESNSSSVYIAERNRYHLYISNSCPFAHRAYLALKLKGLEDIVGVSVTEPVFHEELGWQFSELYPDHVNHFETVPQLYKKSDPSYSGRFSVPVLWDKKTSTVVNNESAEIVRIFNSSFNELLASSSSTPSLELYPNELKSEIDSLNTIIADNVNIGVYKVGTAKNQEDYDSSFDKLFKTLDELEERFENRKYLFGDLLVETDIRLFVTLIRFDIVYYHLMKCNLKQIQQYRNLKRYLLDLYQQPIFKSTVNFNEIKTGDYKAKVFNPSGIIAKGPNIDYLLSL